MSHLDAHSPLLVTGGAGFIGANFVRAHVRDRAACPVVNLDALTYAGNRKSLASLDGDTRHVFVHGDILDRALVSTLLERHRPCAIVHFAAETHVDRSIHGPSAFLRTNVEGTFSLLESALSYWRSLTAEDQQGFRFLHVSTDEVYGTLTPEEPAFREDTPFAPNSPYAASKAASDHLVRAWHHTYGLPTLVTNCSNNYGPFQFPEKLIPLTIANALAGEPLPVYGDGMQVRDWVFVEDHCRAIETVLSSGRPGEVYNIGGGNQQTNLSVVQTICSILDELRPGRRSYAEQIRHVADRPGHDRRYAIDATKVRTELGWAPQQSFADGLRRTVAWYLAHQDWVEDVMSGAYRDWMNQNYGRRSDATVQGEAR